VRGDCSGACGHGSQANLQNDRTPGGLSRKQSSVYLTGGRPDRKYWKFDQHRAKLEYGNPWGIVMDIAVEKMTIAEKLLAMERLWNSLQAEETFTPPDWHEQVLSERLQALRDGQVQFSPLEEVAERLRGVRK
jgi:putative addiction module component (TIGR02574 family)